MTFRVTCVTLFPEAFPGTLGLSIVGAALERGAFALDAVDIRPFGVGRRLTVDDTPSGGGAGLVMRADVAAAAIDSVSRDGRPVIYLSPRGAPLTQARVRELAAGPGVILLCGRFEGLDERVRGVYWRFRPGRGGGRRSGPGRGVRSSVAGSGRE